MYRIAAYTHPRRIAYFTMEIALRPEIHTYSGGLGVLAGDTARSAADLELPLVVVTLVSRSGYVRQSIDAEGRQVEQDDRWDPAAWAAPLGAKVALALAGREVWLQPWLYPLEGSSGCRVPVLMLDTDLPENAPEDRTLTDRLYGDGAAYRLKQEAVLGLGGVRMLRALGFEVYGYHLNEGHSALLAVELLQRKLRDPATVASGESRYDVQAVRERCIFTTHTPVEAGHDRFPYDLVRSVLDDGIELDELRRLGGQDELNMTQLALSLSGYVNGVARRHAELAGRRYPPHRVHAITNGVHARTWVSESLAELFESHFPGWLRDPGLLLRAQVLPDEALWAAHQAAKRALLARVAELTGVGMSEDVPVLGFARRVTGYKRPELLFTDLERLRSIHRRHPLQVVLAGKAHPRDEPGKALIRRLHGHIAALRGEIAVAFLPNYDMALARYLVSGSDVWVNTPLPPLEASGTSGMKAALNGVLNLSVLDGWWIEGCVEGVNGWAIGDGEGTHSEADATALYDKLEHAVLPLYYRDRSGWLGMMKAAVAKSAWFSSHRMMWRYAAEAYLGSNHH